MRYVVVLICALSCSACMQETVRFAAKDDQQAIIHDGQPALISTGQNSVVMIRPATRQFAAGGRPIFVVAIHNLGKEPLDFAVKNVRVTQTTAHETLPLKVFTYEELVQEEKTREVVSALLLGAAAGVDAAAAAQAGRRTTVTTVNSPKGGYSYTTTSYSPARALAAERHAVREDERFINAAVKQGQRNLKALERQVLKDDTLMPGEWYGGTLSLQPPAEAEGTPGPKTYSIALSVGPDQHEIDVVQNGVK